MREQDACPAKAGKTGEARAGKNPGLRSVGFRCHAREGGHPVIRVGDYWIVRSSRTMTKKKRCLKS